MARDGRFLGRLRRHCGRHGCLRSQLPHPLTAADVARFDSGSALVTYLGQRDADPAVCDTRSPSSHISHFDQLRAATLVRGLNEGKIDPGLWQRCVAAALDSGPPGDAAAIIDVIGRGYRDLATNDAFEKSPAMWSHIGALQTAYIGRPVGKNGDAKEMAKSFDELRKKLLAGKFGPIAARFVGEMLGVVDLEQGRYGGRPVDAVVIADAAARGDQMLLHRFADRLPAQDLRDQARRSSIRLDIAASPFAEVRAQAAAVEERVFREGINRVLLAEHPAANASLDQTKLPVRTVLARQDIEHQTATLLGFAVGSGPSVLPGLSLAGALWVDVDGLSRPITICQAPGSFDPTPCLAASDVRIENVIASVDSRGTFQFRDRVTEAELIGVTGMQSWFPMSIDVGGKRMVALRWPLQFEQTGNLVLNGGPDLKISIKRVDPSLFAFTVTGTGTLYRAIVEKTDLAAFHVVSVGAAGSNGRDGFDGSDGTTGMSGTSASCPSMSGSDGSRGGDGGRGEDGGDGGNGGNGGNIQVDFDCGPGICSVDDVVWLKKVAASRGGAGGSGGRGGRGGHGGRGGSGGAGTTCFDSNGGSSSVSGGMDGSSGFDGMSGNSGRDGYAGSPGQVTFRVVSALRS